MVALVALQSEAIARPPQPLPPETAIRQAEAAIGSIASYDVTYKVTKYIYFDAKQDSRPPFKADDIVEYDPPLESVQHLRQISARGLRRLEVYDDPEYKRLAQLISSGPDTERVWIPNRLEAYIRKTDLNVVDPGAEYAETYRCVRGRLPLIQSLRERQTVTAQAAEEGRLMVLECGPSNEPGVHYANLGYRVTLEAKYGLLPTVIEWFTPGLKGPPVVSTRTRVTEFRRLPEGTHVPIRAVTDIFRPIPGIGADKPVIRLDLVVDVVRSKWNEPIGDETFQVQTPAGARVLDTIKDVSYVTGKPDPGKNLDDLAATAGPFVQKVSRSMPPAASRWQWVWVGGGLALAVAVAVLVLRRRNRRPVEG